MSEKALSEAQRLANLFDTECAGLHDGYAAARLLRRLDAENKTLRAALAYVDEALKATVKEAA